MARWYVFVKHCASCGCAVLVRWRYTGQRVAAMISLPCLTDSMLCCCADLPKCSGGEYVRLICMGKGILMPDTRSLEDCQVPVFKTHPTPINVSVRPENLQTGSSKGGSDSKSGRNSGGGSGGAGGGSSSSSPAGDSSSQGCACIIQ